MIETRLARDLMSEEQAALSRYGADSTLFHAVAQGYQELALHHPDWGKLGPDFSRIVKNIEDAIANSALVRPATLYSCHGGGRWIRGGLSGNPGQFVGLNYSYAGFISTSSERGFAEMHLGRRDSASATMLEFELPAGFNAIDMVHGGQHGEFELLLGRGLTFRIKDASSQNGVLWLVLEP